MDKKLKCYSYIRLSTPAQINGHGKERQIELAESYSEKHGLELDRSLTMQDLGISAYKGEQRTKGALAKFLSLVEKGKIDKGSILIVESLDRLSREAILTAFTLFSNIIQKGITIVTLTDNMEYNQDNINDNIGNLMISLTILSRAHEESKTKSLRLKSAWENKRKNIGKIKLTGRCPEWLSLSEDKKKFTKIKGREKIIESIYKMKLDGNGSDKIAQRLNEKNVSWIPKNGWRKSYINKILRTRAVIGEYQVHKMVDGKRALISDPIPDYFPKVVHEDLFYAVQERIKSNRENSFGGRTGKVRNVFSSLLKCGYCGKPMYLINKGNGDSYLICDHARRGVGCIKHLIRYDEFEKLALEFTKGLNASDIIPGNEEIETELIKLNKKLTSGNNQLFNCQQIISNIEASIDNLESPEAGKIFENRLVKKLDEKKVLEKDIEKLEKKIQDLSKLEQDESKNIESVKELINLMETTKGQDLIDIRLKLREVLKQLIDEVKILPIGYKPKSKKSSKEDRGYLIKFKTGDFRYLTPTRKDKVAVDGIVISSFTVLREYDKKGGKLIKETILPEEKHQLNYL